MMATALAENGASRVHIVGRCHARLEAAALYPRYIQCMCTLKADVGDSLVDKYPSTQVPRYLSTWTANAD